jgi:hypothetical protein
MNQGNKIKHALIVTRTVKDVLFVKIPEFVKEHMTLEILRMDGIKVFENKLSRNDNAMVEIPLAHIKSGTYLIHINADNKFVVDTFEKK